MKKFLFITATGLFFVLPGIAGASSLDNSGGTPLFDPHGSATACLPPPIFYRAYDCRIGSKPGTPPVVTSVVITPPANQGTTTNNDNTTPPPVIPDPGTGGITPTITPPDINTIVPPIGGNTAAVPLPDPAEMSGAGFAVTALFSWIRSKRLSRRR